MLIFCTGGSKAIPHNSRLTAQAPLRQLRHGSCVAKMLDNVGLRYPHRASGAKALALCDRCPCFGSLFPPLAALTFAASSIICAFGLASAAPRSPYRHLELCGIALIKIVPPSYLPTFSLRPDFALFFCPFAQEKDSHSMEKALLSFRQQGNFYNVLFSDLCRITGGSNAVRCSS